MDARRKRAIEDGDRYQGWRVKRSKEEKREVKERTEVEEGRRER